MELHDALTQIAEIRQQMARAEVFRGYRSLTTAFSGLLALAASAAHAWWLPGDWDSYVVLWGAVAIVSLIVVAAEMVHRSRVSGSQLQRDMTSLAVQQFTPALVAGGLLTFAMIRFKGSQLWMLPALWAVMFSLGIFASRRLLPRGTELVGGYYLLAGLLCLALTPAGSPPWPWTMALTFGVGQLLAACILYVQLERRHGQS